MIDDENTRGYTYEHFRKNPTIMESVSRGFHKFVETDDIKKFIDNVSAPFFLTRSVTHIIKNKIRENFTKLCNITVSMSKSSWKKIEFIVYNIVIPILSIILLACVIIIVYMIFVGHITIIDNLFHTQDCYLTTSIFANIKLSEEIKFIGWFASGILALIAIISSIKRNNTLEDNLKTAQKQLNLNTKEREYNQLNNIVDMLTTPQSNLMGWSSMINIYRNPVYSKFMDNISVYINTYIQSSLLNKADHINVKILIQSLYIDKDNINSETYYIKQNERINLLSYLNYSTTISENNVIDKINLSKLNLQNKNLSNTDFSHTILSNSNLNHIILNNSNIISTDLQNSHIKEAILSHVNAENANFSNTHIHSTNLDNINLMHTNFTSANLSHTIFEECDLSYSILHSIKLTKHTNFTNSNMTEINMKNAMISHSSFNDIFIIEASLSCSYIESSNFINVDFTDTHMYRVHFHRCDFSDVNSFSLTGKETSFTHSYFTNVNFKKYKIDTPITNSTFVYDKDNSFLHNPHIRNHIEHNKIEVDNKNIKQFKKKYIIGLRLLV